MTLAILVTSQQVPSQLLDNVQVVGELGLDGVVRPCRGIIGKLLAARKLGFTAYIIPEANRAQAQLVPNPAP